MPKLKTSIQDEISGIERDPDSPSCGKQVLFRIKFPGDKSGDMVFLWEEAEKKKMSGQVTVGDSIECIEDKVVKGRRMIYVICKEYPTVQEGWIWESQLTNYGKEFEDERKKDR